MKVLILTKFKIEEEELILKNLRCQMDIYTYHVVKYLREKGVDMIFYNCHDTGNVQRIIDYFENEFDPPEADHAIVFGQRGVIKRPSAFFEKLRPKIKGKICTFSAVNKIVGNEDILFYSIPCGKKNKEKCRLINWAANEELCRIDKDPEVLRILIDHSYYSDAPNNISNTDLSWNILQDVCKFAKESDKYCNKKVLVRRFVSNGVETVDIENPYYDRYNHRGLNYEDTCKEYSKADIFIVTHMECMGLSVLESAMAGALVLSSKVQIERRGELVMANQIKVELLKGIHNLVYEGDIPWTKVLKYINPEKSRQKALRFTWKNSVDRIYSTLNE